MKPPPRIPVFSLPHFPKIVLMPEGLNLYREGVFEVPTSMLPYHMAWDTSVATIAAVLGPANVANGDAEWLKVPLPQYRFDNGSVRRILDELHIYAGDEPIITISVCTKPLIPGMLKALQPLFAVSRDSDASAIAVHKALEAL